jgi:hypothetical protein
LVHAIVIVGSFQGYLADKLPDGAPQVVIKALKHAIPELLLAYLQRGKAFAAYSLWYYAMRFQDLDELIPRVGLIQAAVFEKLCKGRVFDADIIKNE